MGGGGRQRHAAGEKAILKLVALVGVMVLVQQRKHLRPADEKTTSEVKHL